jgi:hypothetical protein
MTGHGSKGLREGTEWAKAQTGARAKTHPQSLGCPARPRRPGRNRKGVLSWQVGRVGYRPEGDDSPEKGVQREQRVIS